MDHNSTADSDTIAKLLGVAFVGLHLPLVAVGLAHFVGGFTDAAPLVLSALVGTVFASVLTLGMIWRSVAPRLQGALV
jgi:hypothetical protein